MVGDAGGAALVTADEAEAVGQQGQAPHLKGVREGAQDGAVADVEELDVPVVVSARAVSSYPVGNSGWFFSLRRRVGGLEFLDSLF